MTRSLSAIWPKIKFENYLLLASELVDSALFLAFFVTSPRAFPGVTVWRHSGVPNFDFLSFSLCHGSSAAYRLPAYSLLLVQFYASRVARL